MPVGHIATVRYLGDAAEINTSEYRVHAPLLWAETLGRGQRVINKKVIVQLRDLLHDCSIGEIFKVYNNNYSIDANNNADWSDTCSGYQLYAAG